MKLQCVDGNVRDFEFVRDRLLRFGFDPTLLDKDQSLISISLPPNTGVFEAIKLARAGINLPAYIFHWSKKSKRINPVSVSFVKFFDGVGMLAFLPSIEVEKETSLFGNIDLITWIARVFTKIFRIGLGEKDKSTFRTLIYGDNSENIQFNYGYKVLGVHYIEKANDYFLLISDQTDSVHAVSLSVIGFTNKVLISSNND